MLRFSVLIIICLLNLALAKPQMAIVIDDFGYSLTDCKKFLEIGQPITLAVIPGQPFSRSSAYLIKQSPHQLLIHFPWHHLGYNAKRKYPIRLDQDMDKETMQIMFTKAVESVPGANGINNHMGSVLSKDPEVMKKFMSILSKFPEKYFLDSFTSRDSVAYWYARKAGIKSFRNNDFLDGKQNAAYIEKQFVSAIKQAKTKGSVIAICHGNRPVTKRILKNLMTKYNTEVDYVYLPDLRFNGVTTVNEGEDHNVYVY